MEAVQRPEYPLPEVQKKRLVIALDYGTTYTGQSPIFVHNLMGCERQIYKIEKCLIGNVLGLAYTLTTESKANLDEIMTIYDWGNGVDNEEKIRSVISYTRGIQWGGKLEPGSIAMVHTKLQLQLRSTSHELDYCCQALEGMNNLDFRSLKSAGSLPPYTWKSPETIVEDFLSKMFESLKSVHGVFNSEVLEDTPVDIVATIPAVR